MKKLLLIFLTYLTSFSNTDQVKVNVINNTFSLDVVFNSPRYRDTKHGKFIIRDYYEYDDPIEGSSFKLPFKEFLIAIPVYSKPIVSVIPGKTTTIPDVYPKSKSHSMTQIASTGNTEIKPHFEVLGFLWIREFYCLRLRINTHLINKSGNGIDELSTAQIKITIPQYPELQTNSNVKITDQYDELISELIVNSQIAEQFRNKHRSYVDSGNSWINYNNSYLKFCVSSDGLYRITKSDLDSIGIDMKLVNPNTFKIFESGKEQPCYVLGEEDGSFDNNDYIEFWGTKNYSKNNYRAKNPDNEEYHEYLNRYTDTSFYFLTWGGPSGLRISNSINYSVNVVDSIDYFSSLCHFETNREIKFINNEETLNQKPDWNKNKTWVADQISPAKPAFFNFSAPGLIKGKTTYFYSKIISYASDVRRNSHLVKLLVNGVLIDSQAVDRYNQCLLQGKFNSEFLNEDENYISIENSSNATKLNTIIYDWYECEYPRKLSLSDNLLYFRISSEVNAKPRAIIVSNVKKNNYEVYKIRPSIKKISNYHIESDKLFIVDSVSGGDRYFISQSSKIQKPRFCYSPMASKLRNETAQIDYIAITNSKFWKEALDYTRWISATFSISTKLVNVQDIYDEFGFGYPDPQSIKNFLQYTTQNWKSPKPTFVSLIGDASYDYKNNKELSISRNTVPSYGYPVGDNWFVIFDDNFPIPQMKLGRIPINTSAELEHYFAKLRNNNELPYTNWNKQFLFFSGGIKPEEYAPLKAVNDSIVNYVKLPPVAGQYHHFYKTITPQSDFGPYSDSLFYNAIFEGGVFISYIGHSGTAVWDNSISDINQLKNKINRNPLVTDFGCSTNKFAEPDITSFGEKFLLNSSGQALAYIGNSSLGFTNVSCSAPRLFYEAILEDSLHEIGRAHLYTKLKLLQKMGNTPVAKIFCYTNTLLGDPAIRLKIPLKPNLTLNERDVFLKRNELSTDVDSVEIILKVRNSGLAYEDSIHIEIEHYYNERLLQSKKMRIKLPENSESAGILIGIKNKPGIHKLLIKLDPCNCLNEIYETDNQIDFSFNVYSKEIRDLLNHNTSNGRINKLCILHPVYSTSLSSITLQYAENQNFLPAYRENIKMNSFFTEADLSALKHNTRYWLRYYSGEDESRYSPVKSFYHSDHKSKFLVCDSVSANELSMHNTTSYPLKLSCDSIKLSIVSSGWSAGANCVIAKQGRNLLGNTFFAGMGIVVFDETTLQVDTSAWYTLFLNPDNMRKLTDLINSIPPGKIVLMGVADDAANNISSELKNAIKTLGSTKIDQLKFRGSWALIGKKGALPGCVIEDVKDPYDGSVYLDSVFVIRHSTGEFITQNVGPASKWESIQLHYQKPHGSRIKLSVLGINKNGHTDFLGSRELSDSIIYIDSIKNELYKYISLKTEFTASPDGLSPSLSLLGVDYTGAAELGTNYQCVIVSPDTVVQGDSINIKFSVYNAGESASGSFNVKLELLKPDNSSILLLDSITAGLDPGRSKDYIFTYLTSTHHLPGKNKFRISIDPGNNITELYKDNNVFETGFYIIADTTSASVTASSISITFDGKSIVDGDYVSPDAELKAVLHYPIWFPVKDTGAVRFFLDDKQIFYSQMNISVDTSARKQIFRFIPHLHDGEHLLKVHGINAFGIIEKIPGYRISFRVQKELKLFNVYNYPNPFSSSTSFTFTLTQPPDQLLIKIYTVAGRLIRSIDCSQIIHAGFNTIPWDGRDQDGDPAANGIYLYKVIVKKEDRSEQVIQKLAIIK